MIGRCAGIREPLERTGAEWGAKNRKANPARNLRAEIGTATVSTYGHARGYEEGRWIVGHVKRSVRIEYDRTAPSASRLVGKDVVQHVPQLVASSDSVKPA